MPEFLEAPQLKDSFPGEASGSRLRHLNIPSRRVVNSGCLRTLSPSLRFLHLFATCVCDGMR